MVLKFWEGWVREGLLKFSKSFFYMQKLAISGLCLQKFSFCACLLEKIPFKFALSRQSCPNF